MLSSKIYMFEEASKTSYRFMPYSLHFAYTSEDNTVTKKERDKNGVLFNVKMDSISSTSDA